MKRAVAVALSTALLAIAADVWAGAWGVASVGVVTVPVVATVARLLAGRAAPPAVSPAVGERLPDFPSHRRIASMLALSEQNAYHFDRVTRPFLRSTAAALLSRSLRVDPERDPATTARLLGDDVMSVLWPLETHGRDGRGRLGDVELVVERLERL